MTQIDTLEKLQRTDHDTLIRLESKVDSIVVDIREIKEGTTQKIANINERVKLIEKVHDEINPEGAKKQLDEATQWIHDFRLTYKVIIAVAAVVGGIVSFFLSIIVQTMKLFER